MATATSPNIGPIVGSLMPRISSTNLPSSKSATASLSRESSPLDQTNLKPQQQVGMPAEHSSPKPSSIVSGDSPDIVFTKPSPGPTTSGFATLATLAGALLTGGSSSAQSEEMARRQKLEKYRKKLRENLAEQEALVNKRIAASVSSAPSQRSVREFEQKIHVLAGKAQKLGRSIAQLEAQIASPTQHGGSSSNVGSSNNANNTTTTETPVSTQQAAIPSRPSLHSIGKALSISTSNNTPPNPVTPSGPSAEQFKPQEPAHHPAIGLLQRTGSSSSSHSQSAGHQTSGSFDKAATMPVPQAQLASRVLKDVKESISSTFRLRPSQTTQEQLSASGGGVATGVSGTTSRKFGSADNLHQLNTSNVSSSSGSCETTGSGAQMSLPVSHGQQLLPHTGPKSTVSHHSNQPPVATAGAVLATSAIPALAMEKAKSTTHSSHTHTGVPGRPYIASGGVGEKANPGTLPAKLRSSTSFPHFKTQYGFKYAPPGDSDSVPPLSAPLPSMIDEQLAGIGDDSVSQTHQNYPPQFGQSYHFQGSPTAYAVPREIVELKEGMESFRLQLQQLDRHWHEKLENLRVELTDVKYLLHIKPSREDIEAVIRRCDDYSVNSTEAVEHLRNDVIIARSELARQDQDLDNTIERLRRRVEELDFDAVATRLTLVEAKVSQVSNYVPGPEHSLRNVAAKLLNVLFILVALFLLLISTAISMATPFIRTRIRIIVSAVLALVLAILYHFWLWRLFADEEILPGMQDQTL